MRSKQGRNSFFFYGGYIGKESFFRQISKAFEVGHNRLRFKQLN